jgi:hypothetical protein
MASNRFLTIHFTDGSNMSVTFPKQAGEPHQMLSRVQKALDANQLAMEIGDELFVVPMNNIKYMQVSPRPDKLPDTVIRGGVLKGDY